jgi:hypothetical protein
MCVNIVYIWQLYIVFQLIMNVWKSCYTISQIIDLGFNFGLNPPPTHIGGHIIELWLFVFHFCNFWDRYFVLYINHSQVQNGWRFWKKKHFSVIQPNLKPNLIKDSSCAHHILHFYTRHYFPYNCLCNRTFHGNDPSQIH